jgi:hypothetical protein
MIKRSNPKRKQLPLKDQMKNGSESKGEILKSERQKEQDHTPQEGDETTP